MKFNRKYIFAPLLAAAGVVLAFASKMLFLGDLNSVWRTFIELAGYAAIAGGIALLAVPKK